MDAFTGLYMSSLRADGVMETTLVGDPLSPAPLEGAINEQDQRLIGSQEGLGEQLQENPAQGER